MHNMQSAEAAATSSRGPRASSHLDSHRRANLLCWAIIKQICAYVDVMDVMETRTHARGMGDGERRTDTWQAFYI